MVKRVQVFAFYILGCMITTGIGFAISVITRASFGLATSKVKSLDLNDISSRFGHGELVLASMIQNILDALLVCISLVEFYGGIKKVLNYPQWIGYGFCLLFLNRLGGFVQFAPLMAITLVWAILNEWAYLMPLWWMSTILVISRWWRQWIPDKYSISVKPVAKPISEEIKLSETKKAVDQGSSLTIKEKWKMMPKDMKILLICILQFNITPCVIGTLGWIIPDFVWGSALIFLASVPFFIFFYKEAKQSFNSDYASKWNSLYFCVFLYCQFSIGIVPDVVLSLVNELHGSDFAVLGLMVGYHFLMQYIHLAMKLCSRFTFGRTRSVKFRLISQIFDDIYADLVIVFVRSFDIVYFLLLISQAIRIILRDGGAWRKVFYKLKCCRKKYDENKAKARKRTELQVKETAAFAIQKFFSEISSTMIVPFLILLEKEIMPEAGCWATCNVEWGAGSAVRLILAYFTLLMGKIMAYVIVYYMILKEWNENLAELSSDPEKACEPEKMYACVSRTVSYDMILYRTWKSLPSPELASEVIRHMKSAVLYYVVVLYVCINLLIGPMKYLTSL